MAQADLGNTSTKSSSLKSRKWCFTLNNWTESELTQITQEFEGSEYKYIIGKETSQNGTAHLQGYVEAPNAIAFSRMKKIMPRAHIEKAKGKREQNIAYCSKEGNVTSNIDTDIGITPSGKYDAYMTKKYKDVQWHPWQREILDLLETEPSERKVYWYWEETGNVGKSFLTQYIDWKYDAIIAEGKRDDVFNQYRTYLEKKQPSVAIMDVPRCNKEYVSYGMIEKIKNGIAYSGKYEGGKLRIIPHHLIVFANFEPDVSKLSADRWVIREL